jgi:hypothetical protein
MYVSCYYVPHIVYIYHQTGSYYMTSTTTKSDKSPSFHVWAGGAKCSDNGAGCTASFQIGGPNIHNIHKGGASLSVPAGLACVDDDNVIRPCSEMVHKKEFASSSAGVVPDKVFDRLVALAGGGNGAKTGSRAGKVGGRTRRRTGTNLTDKKNTRSNKKHDVI